MNHGEMAVLVKGIAPVLRDAIVRAVQPVADRLRQLELRELPEGPPGKDGQDGLGFDDMDVCVLEDDRTIEISFRRGDEEKVFTLKWPTVLDRGPFKVERELPYEPGDGVTWGGQFYICNEQTNEKPDLSKDGKPWRLAVRKGRDGKDAKIG